MSLMLLQLARHNVASLFEFGKLRRWNQNLNALAHTIGPRARGRSFYTRRLGLVYHQDTQSAPIFQGSALAVSNDATSGQPAAAAIARTGVFANNNSSIPAVAYFVTGKVEDALTIGAVGFFGKIFIYYLHERAWQMAPRGMIRKLFRLKN